MSELIEPNIGNRLFQLRNQRNMSQAALGVKVGLSQESISSIETGGSFPKFETLLNLATCFDCSLDYLVGLSNVKQIAINQSSNDTFEQHLISNFRRCSTSNKTNLLIISAILSKENLEIALDDGTTLIKNYLEVE